MIESRKVFSGWVPAMLQNPTPLRKGQSGPCIRRGQLLQRKDVGVMKTQKKEEGPALRAGPSPANITPGPELLTDEDVDFSWPQENGSERLLRLMRRKMIRGDDDIPEALKHWDICGMKTMPPPSHGAYKPKPRVISSRSPAVPAPPTGRKYPDYDSEDWRSDSDMSSILVDSEGLPAPSARTASKRRSDDDTVPPLSEGVVPKAKRCRGRPPTTGQYVGLAAARAELNRAKEDSHQLKVEEEFVDCARRAREVRARSTATPATPVEDAPEHSIFSLALSVEASLTTVTNVTKNSKSLKGTYVKCLNEAVDNIREAMAEMKSCSTTEEMSYLLKTTGSNGKWPSCAASWKSCVASRQS